MDSTSTRRFGFNLMLVTMLCLGGAGAAGYFLYQDFNESGTAGSGKPLATLVRREAKVRRKAASSYVWTNTRPNEDLYRKDSVQTSSGSAAAIQFADGSVLDLGENSLVVIDDLQNLSLNFLRGQMVVHKADGKDSRIVVGEDGQAKVEELKIRLLRPEPLARLFVPEKKAKDVFFNWEAKAGSAPESYVLQVSTNRGFPADRTTDISIADIQSKQARLSLGAGDYFWRIRTKSSIITESRQFRIVAAAPIRPLFPAPGQKVLNWSADGSIQFRLMNPASNQAATEDLDSSQVDHKLEVAKDQEFKKILLAETVNPASGGASLKGIDDGTYFWRVKSRYGDLVTSSAAEKFTVEKAKKISLELMGPEEGGAYGLKPQFRFNWTCDRRDLDYQWELRSSDGKVSLNSKTRSQAFVWKGPTVGDYRWRVVAFAQGQSVGETAWRSLSIAEHDPFNLIHPARNQSVNYWDKPTPVTFKWDKESGSQVTGSVYRLEVATEPTFKTGLLTKDTRVAEVTSEGMKLIQGTLYWRVRVMTAQGQILRTSDVSRFIYGPYPLLPSTVETLPAAGTSFNPMETGKDPTLSWAPVEGAVSYEVSVYSDVIDQRAPASPAPKPKLVFHGFTPKTAVALKGIQAGNYTWTVQPIDKMKRKGSASQANRFGVTYGDLLEAPVIVSPEVQ